MESVGPGSSRNPFEQDKSLNQSTFISASPLSDSSLQWGQSATTLLFVDAGVKNYQALVAGAQPGTEVHVLNASQDAIAQITTVLTGRANIASLQIVSHGTTGAIKLGETWLDSNALEGYSNQIRAWSNAFTDDADILIYGCDVAKRDRTFIDRLATLTGADVAASDDATGSLALGGDWDLEVQSGKIESGSALSQASRDRLEELLDLRLNWAQRTTGDHAGSIGVDSAGNTYVATAVSGPNGWGVTLSKLDPAGTALWTRTYDTKAAENVFKVAVDSTNDAIYLLGDLRGSATFGATTLSSASPSLDDIFITKLNGQGTVSWARRIGAGGLDTATDLAVDSTGAIYVAGNFQGTVDFDPGAGTQNRTAGGLSAFVLKWNANGTYAWATQLGGTAFTYGKDLEVGAQSVYLVGEFNGAGTFGTNNFTSNNTDGFIATFNAATGAVTAATQITGAGNESVKAIAAGTGTDYYYAGEFSDTTTINATALTSAGGTDIFLAKAGTTPWVKQIGSTADDEVNSIAIAGNNLYMGGSFTGTVDFDPNAGTRTLTADAKDAYVGEYDTSGNLLTVAKMGGAGDDAARSLQLTQGKLYVAGTAGLDADLDPADTTRTVNTGGTGFVTRLSFNAAPVLANTPLVIPAIDEDIAIASNTGTLIKDLVTTGITDSDTGAKKGIAITAIDNTNGAWQFSLNGTTWTAITAASETAALLLADDATTRLRFVPNANYNGTVNLSLRAWDQTSGANGATANVTMNGGDTAFSTQAVQASLIINAVNDQPISTPATVRSTLTGVVEDTAITFQLGLNGTTPTALVLSDVDLGNNDLEVTLSSQQGILSLASTANLTFTAGDGTEDATMTFKGKVADVNAAIASLTYKGNPNYFGNDTINLVASDLGSTGSGGAKTFTQAIAVTIMNVNDAPTAANGTATTAEDTALTNQALPIATDPETNPITYELIAGSAVGGTAVVNASGTYTFTPTANFNGPASFRYRVRDNQSTNNLSPEYTMAIAVTPVNDAPVSANSTFATAPNAPIEDTAFTGTLAAATDVDGDTPLTYEIVTNPTKGAVVFTNANTGAFTFTPTANANGTDSFTYRVIDGKGGISPTYTANLTIAAVNDAPTAANGTATTLEDTALTNQALPTATDIETNPVTYELVAGSAVGGTVVVNAAGTYTFTPTANFNGPASFRYRVRDNQTTNNLSPEYTMAIAVTPVNDAPVSANSQFTPTEDTVFTGTLPTATDVENDTPLTYEIVTGPTKGTVAFTDASRGAFTFTPTANANGADSFTYRVKDPNGGVSPTYTATLAIAAVNDAPTAANGTATTAEDTPITGITAVLPAAIDLDNNPVTYSLVAGSAVGGTAVVNANGSYTFTPTLNFNGAASFKYLVRDNQAQNNTSPEYTMAITVTEVNDKPTFTRSGAATLTINAGAGEKTLTNWATGFTPGPANESTQTLLGYEIVNSNSAIFDGPVTIDAQGNIKFKPIATVASAQTATITIRAKDSGGTANTGTDLSDPQTLTITVAPRPTVTVAPVVAAGTAENSANLAFVVTLSAAPADMLSYTFATADGTATVADNDYTATNGTLTFNTGELRKTITVALKDDAKFELSETFTLTVNDGANPVTGTGTITDNDPKPTIAIANVSEGEGTADFVFDVMMTGETSETVVMNYNTVEGTAKAGTDFVAVNSSLTLKAGVNKITVKVIGDKAYEENESFTLNLSTTNQVNPANLTATATIRDDDPTTTLFMRSAQGEVVVREFRGTTFFKDTPLLKPDLTWQIQKIGDFDLDGDDDILWRNTQSGENSIWKMDGTKYESSVSLFTISDQNWQIAAVENLVGDSSLDLIWRNRSTGEFSVWEMNAMAYKTHSSILYQGSVLRLPQAEWQIQVVGDFTQDGKADIMWRNLSSGVMSLWTMNGSTLVSFENKQQVDLAWNFVGAADFDKDGDLDLTWHKPAIAPSTTDEFNIWDMSGAIDGAAKFLTPPSSTGQNWKFVGIADLDLDQFKDLLYYNTTSGEIWALPLTGLNSKGNPFKVSQLIDLTWKIEGVGEINRVSGTQQTILF
jgi:Domain of unknown function (DUF4347)/Bacterial Ig domain/Calx-beta domain